MEVKPTQIIVWSTCGLSQICYLDVTKSFSCQEHRLLSYWETFNNRNKICTKWSPPWCYLSIGDNLFLWQYCNPVIRSFFPYKGGLAAWSWISLDRADRKITHLHISSREDQHKASALFGRHRCRRINEIKWNLHLLWWQCYLSLLWQWATAVHNSPFSQRGYSIKLPLVKNTEVVYLSHSASLPFKTAQMKSLTKQKDYF